MKRLRLRWVLPAGHFLIDALVLVSWLWHSQAKRSHMKAESISTPVARQVLLLQESGRGWNFRQTPSPEFVFLSCGNMPAMLVSLTTRPKAYIQTRTVSWDPWWFLIHESIALSVWFLIGMYTEAPGRQFVRVMLWFIALRAGFAVFITIEGIARFGVVMELLLWLGLVLYFCAQAFVATFRALCRQYQRIR